MSDYNNLVNASILTPTTSSDLGSDTNRYNNIFLNGNVTLGSSTITAVNAVVPRISSISYNGDDTAASPAGGQSTVLSGSGFLSGATVYINSAVVNVVTVASSSSITFSTPAKTAGNYSLIVVNPDGASATFVPGIQYSGTPSWTTAAGTLAAVYETDTINNTLSASSDSTVSYLLASGTLPTGVTLNSSTGVVSGTAEAVSGATTYNFTVNAKDGENQDTSRNFSYTINPDSVTWGTPVDGETLSGINGTVYTQALSATSAAGRAITYTANALPAGLSISGASITGTPSTTSSISSLLTATAATTGKTATRTVNWLVSAPIVGQSAYTTAGSYSWTAPAGVTSVSAVCIGGGGGYSQISSSITPYSGNGGGGGGLGWKNNIAVTPGQSYTVVVGVAGDSAGGYGVISNGTSGGTSYFISQTTVKGAGGGGGTASIGIGGSYVGDGGGSGGNSGERSTSMAGSPSGLAGGAGGGAGGYAGNGGTGGNANPSGNGSAGTDGAGGGGGGGGGVGAQNFPDGRFGGAAAGYGGGTSILGQGTNGAGGVGGIAGVYNGGWANSSGTGGVGGGGTGYGRGARAGSACGTYGGGSGGGGGDGGAVRIIWGTGRSFPSTLTTDQ